MFNLAVRTVCRKICLRYYFSTFSIQVFPIDILSALIIVCVQGLRFHIISVPKLKVKTYTCTFNI